MKCKECGENEVYIENELCGICEPPWEMKGEEEELLI